ncbi:MAG TPA: metalloregulator ArsR/SmtB family transcription factor [Methylophilaceae bacterium]|jgi:DNA-binding transcriptional ArsR family regulator|nr:metalloregulator ArsR/SmtB family transcription factor [Methylophilaceae bacterium]
MNTHDAVTILACLAQEARLEIFRLLVQHSPEGLAAGEIGKRLNIPASTLSFHLKELSHAGLVRAEQSSRFIYYSTDFKAINELVAYLMENCCGGEPGKCVPPACNC